MAEPVRFQHFEVPLREDGSLHELGRGAMGITYKAFDTNLRCFVALKVINAAYLSSDVAKQRFLREARSAAALRHPNVATVFHLGEEGGDCFYAMEYVDGETVEAMMKREGAIPASVSLEIILQVSRALGAAHKQGLVHRDIKPSNLMVVREEEGEFTVKVIDFGLAKSAAGTEGDGEATLTVAGFLGTPHFASPEQLEERELDVRSDIYSLGVTLFYMLAGRAPFSGSLAQVMSQHLHRDPPLEILSDQPEPVVGLLRHMLAKDPAARPQTPADLRREVEACLEKLKSWQPGTGVPACVDEENFETQALPSPLVESPSELGKGTLLAGRYRLMEEGPASDFGRVFRAESPEHAAEVEILVLDPSLLASSEACTRIEDQMLALQKLTAPALQKIFSLERLENNTTFLVLEGISGPSLLDLMRQRKALPLSEARMLLGHLAPAFQELQSAGIPCPDIASREITLGRAELSRPVTEWTGLGLKFNPISPGTPVANPEVTLVSSDFGVLVESGAFFGKENRAYVYALATLAYEMLGGIRGSSSARTVPIPGLSEQANAALRQALDPTVSFDSIPAFLGALDAGASPGADASKGEPVRRATPPALPSAPSSASPLLKIAGVLGILLLLGGLGGGGYYFFVVRQSLPVSTAPASPDPTPSPVPAATPVPAPSPVVATPTPTPSPPSDPLPSAIAHARVTAQNDPAAALVALLDLQKSHPNRPEAREAIQEFLETTLARRESLTPGQITALLEPLESAAGQDFVEAQVFLGTELRESDPEGAVKWMLAAANNGNVEAMHHAGLLLSNDIGTLKKNPKEAVKWFQRAAEKGDPKSMFALGECYQLSKGVTRDPRLAIEWLRKAADLKEPRALSRLGDIYVKGIPGIVQPDLKTAFAYFSAAKDLDFAEAYGNLGALFITAPPGMKDEKMAVELFKQGIEKGDPRSQFFYAVCLEEGRGGLVKDAEAAREAYVKAAELGVQGAQDWCREHKVPFTPPIRPSR
ncbi:MAG: protein kinase [Chthoniobacterales bacterium]|nr:protein kinase [Chthoniobacterales bacterium]